MKYARALAFAAMAGIGLTAISLTSGCAVARNQETVGAYVDDATITTTVKARHAEDKTVSATSISVETLNGTVQLSGFARSADEKARAEQLARGVKGVREVRNNIIVRP
jgi:osmotically-inducible protein OsmY